MRAAAFTLAVTGWLTIFAGPATAQQGIFTGMQAGVETVFSTVSTTSTFASGTVTETESTNIFPTLTLNLDTRLYPSLRFNAGGVFELDRRRSATGAIRTDSTLTRSRPYVLLRSVNPVLSPGVAFYRREGVTRTAGLPAVKLVNDEYAAYLGWKPEGGPQSDVQFRRTNRFDGTRAVENLAANYGSLASVYSRPNLNLHYRGLYLKTEDRIEGLETRQVSHAGRVDVAESFFADRLRWNASFNVDRIDVSKAARGDGGEVTIPVTPFAGLSAISDTPATVTLLENRALIDGDVTNAAGVNLGLPASPVDARMRNLGLDLLTPVEVNRLLIWVDRELPAEIADSFAWEIYSSRDNVVWQRETTVAVARFGTFEPHFEIDFPGLTARYVKVVTRPLSPVVPDASRFADILVTEVQAFIRRPAAEVADRLTQTGYLVNTDVRMRLLDVPALFYEGYYLASGTARLGKQTETLSSGVSVNQSFARIYSVYARVAREIGKQVQGDRTATVSSATFTVEPTPTFRSSVLFSGQEERIGATPTTRRGLIVQNAARPYQGIDILFGFGWTYSRRETGEVSRDRLANVSATVVPREHLSLTVSYDERSATRSGSFSGPVRYRQRRSYATVGFDPSRTIHLVLGGEVIAIAGEKTRTALNVGASWTPFPDGTLQVVFAYNETLRALEFGTQRGTVSTVRWRLSSRSYLDVSFQKTRSANEFVTTDTRILSARVRLFL